MKGGAIPGQVIVAPADSVPFVRGGCAPVEAVQGNRLCGREDLSEGEVDGLVEAERHAAGVGSLKLLVA
jgi:hypothetical protein